LYLSFVLFGHEALVADFGEEKTIINGDVGGILVRGVGGALVGVSFPPNMRLVALLLMVEFLLLYLLLFLLVIVPVTITSIWTFCNIVIGLTTPIANPLGMGFVVLSLQLIEDLPKALDNEGHLPIIKLGYINLGPLAWCDFLLFLCCLECNGLRL
jgi:hypothetical protein